MSPKFRESHPVLASILDHAVADPVSKWKTLDTRAEFAGATARAVGTHRPKDVIALVHKSEMTPLYEQLSVFMAATFLEFIARPDAQASSSGMCAA